MVVGIRDCIQIQHVSFEKFCVKNSGTGKIEIPVPLFYLESFSFNFRIR